MVDYTGDLVHVNQGLPIEGVCPHGLDLPKKNVPYELTLCFYI